MATYDSGVDDLTSNIGGGVVDTSTSTAITDVLTTTAGTGTTVSVEDTTVATTADSVVEPESTADVVNLTVSGTGTVDGTGLANSVVIDLDDGGSGDGVNLDMSGADSVEGGATERVIVASTGADTIVTGNTASTVEAGTGDDSVTSGSSNDFVAGGDGDDSVSSGSGDDSISGGAGNDSINAGDGSDTVIIGTGDAGDDTVDGGTGFDQAQVHDSESNYTVSFTTSSLRADTETVMTLSHNTTGQDVIIKNTQFIEFSDGVIINAATQDQADVARMYQIFDWTGDANGLEYWWNDLDNGHSIQEVAQSFIAASTIHPSTTDLVDISNEEFVTRLYEKIANKTGSDIDTEGFNYWVSELEAKADNALQARADMLVSFATNTEGAAHYDYINEFDDLV